MSSSPDTMKHHRHARHGGFTLIELILYIGMAAILVTTSTLFLRELTTARIKSETVFAVEQQGAFAMNVITQAVRNGTSITSPTIGTSGASLTVATAIPANNPTIFDLSSGALRIKRGAGTATALTNTRVVVSALTFSNLSRASTPGTVRIIFTVASVNTTGRNEYSYQRTFYGNASIR